MQATQTQQIGKEKVAWDRVEEFVSAVAKTFEQTQFTGAYGLPRGGLVLAVMLSHKMHIPLLMAPAKGCLIVDDIADTGDTLLHYSSQGYRIATMYWHHQSKVHPDFTMFEKTGEWIEFPWEMGEND